MSRIVRAVLVSLVAGATLGCGGSSGSGDTATRGGSPPVEAAGGSIPSPAGDGAGPVNIVVQGVGFDGPESALHDPVADVYLVSNFAGDPGVPAGNGFISRVSPDGGLLALKWIDGTAPGVTLHAPRGMTLKGDTLYVADLECVRRFLRETGAPVGEFCFPDSGFLNDVSASEDGWVFLSDTGTGAEGDGVQALHALRPGGERFEVVASGPSLGRPNGVLAAARGVVTAVSFADGRVYRYEFRDGSWTGPFDLWKTPAAMLDGLVRLDDGSLLVSSLESGTIYRLRMDGSVGVAIPGLETPADIGVDRRRRRVLIPELQGNRLEIRGLPPV
jgi:hypothetical protein